MKPVKHGRPAFILAIFLTFSSQMNGLFGQCNALNFDGQNDFVQANSPISGNSDFTFEAWFRSDNTSTTGVCDDNSLADFRWLVGWDDDRFGIGECAGNLRFVFQPICPNSTGLCSSLPTVPIQDGLWHHVAMSKTAISIRVLVDGVLLTNFSGANYDLSGTFRLGSSGSGAVGKNWLGAIDEVRIWNAARADADILATKDCQLAAAEPGLRSLFRFNLGYPDGPNAGLTTLFDLGPAAQNGTLQNFSLDGETSNWTSGPDQICEKYCQTAGLGITAISPIGEVFWPQGAARTFVWTKAVGYSGLYRMKIIKLAKGEEAPLGLPDAGLFYENKDIPDSSFTLPATVPQLDTTARYAWQMETVGLVGGKKMLGPVIVFMPLWGPLWMTVSAFPTMPKCPDECFNVTVVMGGGSFWMAKRLSIYSDCWPHVAVDVLPSPPFFLPAHNLTTLSTGPTESPYYIGYSGVRTVQICPKKGHPVPVNMAFYYFKNTLPCNANPNTCPHVTVNRTFSVANVPNYSGLTLEIEPPTSSTNLTEICDGDPVKFCLRDALGNAPPAGAATIVWEFSSTGCSGVYSPITAAAFSLNQFCFNVPPGVMKANCAAGSKGFDDFCYRAKITTTDPVTGTICTKYSSPYLLRICCPVPPISVVLAVVPPTALNGTLCEGDAVTINVSLSTAAGSWFPPSAGSGSVVTIDWCLNGVPIPSAAGQTSFSYPITVGTADLCFEVKIKNCACPLVTASTCIPVDPMPKCGQIVGCDPVDLTLLSSTPMLCYDICPGHDAAVCMVNPADFMNCLPQWQFSWDNITWVSLGASNPTQNTNTLPCDDIGSPYQWHGETCIYYRICGMPLSMPSGCDPCYSNVIKICLRKTPDVPIVNISPNPICFGSSATAMVTNIETGVTYEWFCNGISVGTGPNFSATQQAWYWVVASNGCEKVESNHVFLKVCKVTAAISCPLYPNQCAKLGDPITLLGCDSQSTCGGLLTFSWSISPTAPPFSASGCILTHTPPATGTTYTLTVTDSNGCSAAATTTIIPCQ